MIVREQKNHFILTRQHDHAHLSGDFASYFEPYFSSDPNFEDVLFAIYEHDRSWITPDAQPKWNSKTQRPYNFMDYPLHEKLHYYKLGLSETEQLNPRAGLLCSMHYVSFINWNANDAQNREFLISELCRQKRLCAKIKITDYPQLLKQFQLLQLCDNLSLYICLNIPGASKEEEHSFFRNGFKDLAFLHSFGIKTLVANWIDETSIQITPNPFKKNFEISIVQFHVSKVAIQKIGLAKAFLKSEKKTLTVFISS